MSDNSHKASANGGFPEITEAVSFKNLTKLYKNGCGIKDVSFSLNEGDVFGFLGPNGAGKTTAMKILTGLAKPDSGDAYIYGQSSVNDYEAAMSVGVGTIIETVGLFGHLTAYEHLKMQSRFFSDVDDNRIDECLHLTGIVEFKNERVKKFSLGMKQRMGIAMAILPQPKVLVLDEPYNGLDVEGMVGMREMFTQLAENNKTTILISSHLIHDVERSCNRVGILYNGTMLDVSATDDILLKYQNMEDYYLEAVKSIDKK